MCSCGCGLCTNTRKTALVYCPPRTAVNSSKWSGRTGLWRMFVLALLTHRRVHHWFLSQHCYSFCRCPLRFSSVDFSPPTAIRDPGAAPSLASPLHHHPLQTSPRAQSHRRPESNSANAKMCRCSTRGGADIKMDGRGDRHGLQHWQVYLFVKEEAIKHGWVFRRQGGLSLTGKWVKSKNVSLLLRDISSCCPRANNKTHTDSFSCSILTLRLTQQEKSLFWLL